MKALLVACVAAAVAGYLVGRGVAPDRGGRVRDGGAPGGASGPPSAAREAPPARSAPTERWALDALPSPQYEDELLGPMRADDPLAATVVSEAISLALQRFVEQAWRAHEADGLEPGACLDGDGHRAAITVRLRLRSEPARLVLGEARFVDPGLADVDRACLSAYFSGEGQVHDTEVGGPLPELDVDVELPIPVVLSAYFETRGDVDDAPSIGSARFGQAPSK